MAMKYYLLLSHEDISVKDQKIEKLINKMIESDSQNNNGNKIKMECTYKHNGDLKNFVKYLKHREKSTVYVIDMHKELDHINFWEIGYAMGKGIAIIGYSDGKSETKVPKNLESLITVPENTHIFVEDIRDIINNLEPKKDIFSSEWPEQFNAAKKEFVGDF